MKPRREPDYRMERLDEELLLYHPQRSTSIYCNPTAAIIWELCDGTRSEDEITALLNDAFPDATETLGAEVAATLKAFREHGAIQPA